MNTCNILLRLILLLMLTCQDAINAFTTGIAQGTQSFIKTMQQTIINKKNQKPNPIIIPLLEAASKKQSIVNRINVERIIDNLIPIALENPQTMRKPIQSGSYRTVWSTVTGDNFVGVLLNHPPSNILGGPSWQIVNGTQGTNIVYWKNLDVRMAGLATLSPWNNGYDLQIRGLEFRWGAKGCPEQQADMKRDIGKVWKVFSLPEEETLGNGVGTLELLYNDGVVRVTRDALRDNTYIHIREPISLEYEKMFSPYKIF